MSWQDRDDANDERQRLGRPGGDWQGMRPTFDNPFTWAITIGRVSGIALRVHVLFLVFIVIMLLRAKFPPPTGQSPQPMNLTLMAIAMASLFVIVLAHEFGHCLACRWMGGQADEILMWPLGGLAFCRPDHRWGVHLVTALGGPFVNFVLCAITGGILGTLTGKWMGVAIPNPLTFGGLAVPEVTHSPAHTTLYLINVISLILLVFNLLPIFPLDGGRIVQSALWPRFGYSRSMIFAVRTGYVGAILLAVFGVVFNQWSVVGVALFGGFVCYITQKQLQWTDSHLGIEVDEYALSVHESKHERGPARATHRQTKADRQALREQQETQEVDRILQKIADTGMGSLTRAERALLKRVTERKRRNR